MGFSLLKSIVFQYCSQQLIFTLNQFKKHLILAVLHISIKYGPFLKIDRTLAISDQYTRILKRFKVNKFRLKIIGDIGLLLLSILTNELINIINTIHT